MGSSPEKLINDLLGEYQFNIFVIGHDYDMNKSKSLLTEIKSYQEIRSFIKNETGHINLYLTRETKLI